MLLLLPLGILTATIIATAAPSAVSMTAIATAAATTTAATAAAAAAAITTMYHRHYCYTFIIGGRCIPKLASERFLDQMLVRGGSK